MFELVVRYLVRATVRDLVVNPTARAVADLATAAGVDDWVSRPAINLNAQTGVQTRISSLVSQEGDWLLQAGAENIDVQFQQVVRPDGSFNAAPTFSEFLPLAAKRLANAVEHFGSKPHRLAAVQEGLLPVVSDEVLKAHRAKLLVVGSPFDVPEPFEWDWRVATRVEREFGGVKEPTNTIVFLKRTEVLVGMGNPTDRLLLSTDINTDPKRVEARFTASEVSDFFTKSPGWHRDLVGATLGFLGV